MQPLDESANAVGAVAGSPEELELTIVIPAYNEEHRLEDSFRRLLRSADQRTVDPARTEVLVVDDGSTDRTAALAGELLTPLPHHRVVSLSANLGKGAAVRRGVALTRSPVVAFVDADMAMDPEQLPALLAGLQRCDLSIADRTLPGSRAEGAHLQRQVASRITNAAVRATTGLPYPDTQCGFKAFRTPAARLLFHCCTIDQFAFDVGLLQWAERFGLGVDRTPVHWRRVGGSRVRLAPDVARMALDVLGLRAGARRPPPVRALDIVGSEVADSASVVRAAGPLLPVLHAEGASTATVLLPLCGAEEAAAHRARLVQRFPEAQVRDARQTWSDLVARRPLRMLPWPGPLPAALHRDAAA